MKTIRIFVLGLLLVAHSATAKELNTDLLIVGGTESGCAAAIQAARMGVTKIVLVNDIDWLGGQFSAEALGAIDENRAHGYDGTVPIPRSGLFREVIDGIETRNAELYGGVKRPGNTRVITTGRPEVSEGVFRNLLRPYVESGQVTLLSWYQVASVEVETDRVRAVRFKSTNGKAPLNVRAKLTVDASDWGDVIRMSGAAWDSGVDPKAEFDEPSAPERVEYPADMNPITWCMILEEQETDARIPKPIGYDPRYFTGRWGWIDDEFAYTTRRLVDGKGFDQIHHPDVLLINTPPIDYPLDVYSADVAAALEANEKGASQKNIVAMTHEQREIVFADARNHSLKFLYHLQSKYPRFRNMGLSSEFGTKDQLPPKPYIRESLRLVAKHVITENEVLGFQDRSNYATEMFPDAVFSWQFEMDFHPTHRSWTTDKKEHGPWEADFRGARRFGRGGTGRCVFPLRSLVPVRMKGLIGAQKNLGYSSIVSSSCRLHDQSTHAGQTAGAVAAVAVRYGEEPGDLSDQAGRMAEIWSGLLSPEGGAPLAIWPFSDVDPYEPGFAAIQHLALRKVLGLQASDTAFGPDVDVTDGWSDRVSKAVAKRGYAMPDLDSVGTRRNFAIALWESLRDQPVPASVTQPREAWKADPLRDGRPEVASGKVVKAINFTSKGGPVVSGFIKDIGAVFDDRRGYGWKRDLLTSTRLRTQGRDEPKGGFVFTRSKDIWECAVPNGSYRIHACFGDSEHEQHGQRIQFENADRVIKIDTQAGVFREVVQVVEVKDGRLTVTIGGNKKKANTCINWLVAEQVK